MVTKRTPLEAAVDKLLAGMDVDTEDGGNRRMNRADLAREMDVKYATMYGYLKHDKPGLKIIERLAAALGIESWELVRMRDEEEKERGCDAE